MFTYNRKGPVIRIPKDVRETIGNDLEIVPDENCILVYSSTEEKAKVIESANKIVQLLRTEHDSGSH